MATQWARTGAGLALALGMATQTWAATAPSVAVVAYNQAAIPSDTLAQAKTEVTRIYRDAGVAVTWLDPAAANPAGEFVIRLLLRRRAVNASASVMGTAIGDAQETNGSAFVFYERVLKTAHERQQDVARVLAYTIAHEMGHILLPRPAHSAEGIMRAAWNGDDLRHIGSGSLRFSRQQEVALRTKAAWLDNP